MLSTWNHVKIESYIIENIFRVGFQIATHSLLYFIIGWRNLIPNTEGSIAVVFSIVRPQFLPSEEGQMNSEVVEITERLQLQLKMYGSLTKDFCP